MEQHSVDVVVIGGGSTGVGAARDAAMRGLSVALVDKGDLGSGTTGRFHGQLHSGGRYVVSDVQSAIECARENRMLRRIHASAIEDCGGMFALLPGDDPGYAEKWLASAQSVGLPHEEISCDDALRREPRLNPGITRAFLVEEGSIDGWKMVRGAALSAQAYGAMILAYHRVVDMIMGDRGVDAVRCFDEKRGVEVNIDCRYVVNAAGPWGGRVAGLAHCYDVDVVCGRGVMVAMNHRLVNTVINRCVWPGDGGTLVPAHTVCIIGTTDVVDDDPDNLAIPRAEVEQMLDSGEQLVPGFRRSRALRAWAGARPLLRDTRVSGDDTRNMSRGMSVIDHGVRDGIENFVSVIGGKLSTYRLMAQHVVDLVCEKAGNTRPCVTADEPVPGSESGEYYRVTRRLEEREAERAAAHRAPRATEPSLDDQIICECELVTRGMLRTAIRERSDATFDDLRRQLRIGMGPCQGGFCSQRVAGVLVSEGACDAAEATRRLSDFLARRWKGIGPVLHGRQARQMALNHWIQQGTLDFTDLPEFEEN